MNNRVYIFDTTLRDGEQSPGATMNCRKNCALRNSLKNSELTALKRVFQPQAKEILKLSKPLRKK